MNANSTNHFHTDSADGDSCCDALFMGGALSGSIFGAIAGMFASGAVFAGRYEIAMSVFGALLGCWALAMLANFLAPAPTASNDQDEHLMPFPKSIMQSEPLPLPPGVRPGAA